MFETPDLTDLAFLASQGYRLTPTVRRGQLVFFRVDIPAEDAERLLRSPERALVGRFHQAFRRLRREIDLFPGDGGERR